MIDHAKEYGLDVSELAKERFTTVQSMHDNAAIMTAGETYWKMRRGVEQPVHDDPIYMLSPRAIAIANGAQPRMRNI